MKQKKKANKSMKQRQKQFVAHWSVAQSKNNYDALADKHASYYFGTTGVMKHLKKLKKVINQQPSNKESQKLAQLLENKIGNKVRENINRALQKSRQKIQVYAKQLKSGSLQKLNKTKYNLNFDKAKQRKRKDERQQKSNLQQLKFPQIAHSKPQIQTGKIPNLTAHTKYQTRQLNTSHNRVVKHDEFLDFLNKRKQKIIKEQAGSGQSKTEHQPRKQGFDTQQQVRQPEQAKKIQKDE